MTSQEIKTWPNLSVGNAKKSVKGEDFRFVCEHTTWHEDQVHFAAFGVFDGHGGAGAANYCKNNFLTELKSALTRLYNDDSSETKESMRIREWWLDNVPAALKDTFTALDAECCQRFTHAGTTASVLVVAKNLLLDEETPQENSVVDYFSANVGDSHSIVQLHQDVPGSGNPKVLVRTITEDHRVATNKSEQERIKSNGGSVSRTGREADEPEDKRLLGPLRMWPGGLMMSRTIGDRDATCSIATPKVFRGALFISPETNSGAGARFMLASDGLWDALPFKAATNEVKGKRAAQAASMLAQLAIKRSGPIRDDVTVVVVDVEPFNGVKGPFDNAFKDRQSQRFRNFSRMGVPALRQRVLSGDLTGHCLWDAAASRPSEYGLWVENSETLAATSVHSAPQLLEIPAGFVYGAKVRMNAGGEKYIIAVDPDQGCVLVDDTLELSSRSGEWKFADQMELVEVYVPEDEIESSSDDDSSEGEWQTVNGSNSAQTPEGAARGEAKENKGTPNNAPKKGKKGSNAEQRAKGKTSETLNTNDLHIGGLASATTKAHVHSYFSQFAPVRQVFLKTDRRSGATFGFVAFSTDRENATKSVLESETPHVLNGATIKVSIPKVPQTKKTGAKGKPQQPKKKKREAKGNGDQSKGTGQANPNKSKNKKSKWRPRRPRTRKSAPSNEGSSRTEA